MGNAAASSRRPLCLASTPHPHDAGPDDRPDDGSFATPQGDPAQHGGGDRIQLVGDADLHARILLDLGTIRSAMSEQPSARLSLADAASQAVSGPVAHLALMQLAQIYVSDNEPLAALSA